MVFLMLINAATQFWVPFIGDIGTFNVAAGLMAPAMIVELNPFVPDLVEERS